MQQHFQIPGPDGETGIVDLRSYDPFTMRKDLAGGTGDSLESVGEHSITLDDGSWWIMGGFHVSGRPIKTTWIYDHREEEFNKGFKNV